MLHVPVSVNHYCQSGANAVLHLVLHVPVNHYCQSGANAVLHLMLHVPVSVNHYGQSGANAALLDITSYLWITAGSC